jgi:hypothetical protein
MLVSYVICLKENKHHNSSQNFYLKIFNLRISGSYMKLTRATGTHTSEDPTAVMLTQLITVNLTLGRR